MEKIKSIMKSRPKIMIGIIVALVLSLPFVINQVLRQQDLRQHASTAPSISFSLSSASNTAAVGDDIDVDIMMNASTNDIGSLQFTMKFNQPASLISLTDMIAQPTALHAAVKQLNNGNYDVVMLNTGIAPVTGNSIKIATVRFKALAPGTPKVTIDPAIKATATNSNTFVPIVTTSPIEANYTITASTFDINHPYDALNCQTALVNSTTSCSWTVSTAYATAQNISATSLKFGIGSATTPAGTCANATPTPAVSNLVTFECAGIPTGTVAGTNNIFVQLAATAKVDTGKTVAIMNTTVTPTPTNTQTATPTQVMCALGSVDCAAPPSGCTYAGDATHCTCGALICTTPTSTPAPTPTPTSVPTMTPVPTATYTAGETALKYTATIPGIGLGDGENHTPIHPNRNVTVILYNFTTKVQIGDPIQTVATFDSTTGKYNGEVMLDTNIVPATGTFDVKIKMNNTLYRKQQGITITTGIENQLPTTFVLVPSDLDQDNAIGLTDYNIALACIHDPVDAACTDTYKALADVNDNMQNDALDMNILQRGFATIIQGD